MPYLLELSGSERIYIQNLIAQIPLQQAEVFLIEYRRRRKDSQTVLMAAVIGLVACPGFQRFWLGEMGMGLVFLFTAGFLAMGSIIDLATYRTLARCHNEKVARSILAELDAFESERKAEFSAPLPTINVSSPFSNAT
jgi:hypothetical protein